MTMKRMCGIFATVVAALVGGWTQQTHAAGDIHSIFPVKTDVHDVHTDATGMHYDSEKDGFITVGQEMRFCVRLRNRDFAPGVDAAKWTYVHTGFGAPEVDWVSDPLRIGIMVGGRLREARLIQRDVAAAYTDLTFSYTAKSGDLALPVKLVDESGREVGSGNDSAKYWLHSDSFKLQSFAADGSATNDVEMWFAPHDDGGEYGPAQQDYDLSLSAINIKTVDFDVNPEQPGYKDQNTWRKVRASSTEVEPYAPTLVIESGVTNDTATTVYLWTTNDAVTLANGTEKAYPLRDGGTAQVYAATIAPGLSEFAFKVRGGNDAVGEIVDIFLSSTPTNIYNESGDLVNNFMVRRIAVIDPPQPSISITLGSARADNLDVFCTTNFYTSVCRLTVELSEKYSDAEDLVINLNPVLEGITDVFADRIIAISKNASGAWRDEIEPNVVRFNKDEDTLTKTLYVYALGATAKSANLEYGVNFQKYADGRGVSISPEAAAAFYSGGIKGCQLRVHGIAPIVVSPVDKATLSFVGGVETEVSVRIADSYRNWTGVADEGYTVVWDRGTGLNSKLTFTGLKPDANGDLKFPVKYTMAKDYDSTLTITNPEGNSTTVAYKVTVSEPARVTLTVDGAETVTVDESDAAGLSVGIQLSEPYGDALYAFIVPVNADATNKTTSPLFPFDKDGNPTSARGVKLSNADLVKPNAKIFLNDGLCYPEFQVVLCTTETYDATKIVTDYQSSTLYVTVNNVVPTVDYINVGGAGVLDGGTTPRTPMGIPKKFEAHIVDVDADLTLTDPATCHVVKWLITDGQDTYPQTFYTVGSNTFWYAFENEGTNKVVVQVMDKDMWTPGDLTWVDDASEAEGGYWEAKDNLTWGKATTIYVNVNQTPEVVIEPAWGSDTVDENQECKFDIFLSMAPSKSVNIAVEVVTNGVPVESLILSATDFKVDRNKNPRNKLTLTNIDGTDWSQGLQIRATVTNETLDTETKARMCDLYQAGTYTFNIKNVDPVFTKPYDTTNITQVAIGQEVKIGWSLKDIAIDLEDGMTVTINGDCDTMTMTSVKGGTSVKDGEYRTTFTSGGDKVIYLTAEDKDGGRAQRILRYYVNPSLNLYLTPQGPDTDGATDWVKAYRGAAGLGAGCMWTERFGKNGTPAKSIDYMQLWNYALSDAETTVYFYAQGYKVGDAETRTGYTPYTYDNKSLDSFFYCWISRTSDGNSAKQVDDLMGYAPAVGRDKAMRGATALPKAEKDAKSYPDRDVTAIFALEKESADNVGDINQDAVPDVFATKEWENGYLYELMGSVDSGEDASSAAGGSGAVAPDLKNVSTYNGDEDYLPSMTSQGYTLISTVTNWVTVGPAFTAVLEIRGVAGLRGETQGQDYGVSGLNYRAGNNGLNLNTTGAWISDPCYTEAETNAFAKFYGLSVPKADAEASEIAAFDAALKDPGRNWSPENRTDPTLLDTDGDGFPDGFEYYFWYLAHVGWMEGEGDDRSLVQLTGHRFTLNDIAVGTLITSDEIEQAFNPTVMASSAEANLRDTDNDGLTDLEELALGTNPIEWDTDGDGLSDYWEVMYGLDPRKADALNGAGANLDGDFMAKYFTEANYLVVTLKPGVNGLPATEIAIPNYGGTAVRVNEEGAFVFTEVATNGITCIPVFRYGNATSEVVSVSRTEPLVAKTYSPEEFIKAFGVDNGIISLDVGASPSTEAGEGGPVFAVSTDAITAATNAIMLIHDQVYNHFGYDPRTAWSDVEGYVAPRWRGPAAANDGPEAVLSLAVGDAGKVQNTAPYTARDEYLLLKYRYMTTPACTKVDPSDTNDKTYTLAGDLVRWSDPAKRSSVFYLGTTNPNVPFTAPDYASSALNGMNFQSDVHGADTDEDGVPDGWELYVGHNPNTADKTDTDDSDGDGLTLVQEYAGTDSCNAYSDVPSIYTNHPGHVSGWYNKFFPTDPANEDTDGDGLTDAQEGASWEADIVYGIASHGSLQFSFIYGDNASKPAVDVDVAQNQICIRGGGLNPCSVDTDGDLLPDPWEREFAGIVFTTEGQPADAKSLDEKYVTLMRRSDGLATGAVALGYYISGGMDGTYPNDAYTKPKGIPGVSGGMDERTGTFRDYDFDHDGLQNFQEYLVQALRHLRYDDADTPLMGSWMPTGEPSSRKFVGFLPMNIMDGETFYAEVKKAGFNATGAWNFDKLGYFAPAPRAWDKVALNVATKGAVAYDETGLRVMLRPQMRVNGRWVSAAGYASTDPRTPDTDGDGMDDYYEVFHGLNPLLGSVAGGTYAYDVIAQIYGTRICNWRNAWTGMPSSYSGETEYDAIKYPWLNGTPEADADGDGLRNIDEALQVNMSSPQPSHTDPTPLWYTDSSAKNFASYTAQYYQLPSDLLAYPWGWTVGSAQTLDGASADWMFAFEENEGYDTDHDGIPDGEEQRTTSTSVSDPLDFSDPDRRQALWFPGDKSAAASRWSTFTRPNLLEYDLLRQFTVEAWIYPEDVAREQVILERACYYGADSISNNISRIRANFRIGIMADGRLYGQYDSNAAVPSSSTNASPRVVGGVLTAKTWMHVALTYNGTTLALYVNGQFLGSTSTTQIPANGIYVNAQEATPRSASSLVLGHGYTTVPSAFVLGARARTAAGIELSESSTFEGANPSYDSYYKGFIDEVRVWDGAQSDAAINANYKKRFSKEDVLALRDTVYAAWSQDATRNDNDNAKMLPVELVLHYNFQTLPSAVDGQDVIYEPSGFTKNVVKAVRADGTGIPGDIYCGWWGETPVHSTVYWNYRWVPWIPNTCGHLPMMDGSAVDSHYWAEYLNGVCYASEAGAEKFVFPNTMTPYPYYSFLSDQTWRLQKLARLSEMFVTDATVAELYTRYRFQLRTGFVGSSDLVPLGGAFAKRMPEMWDGNGASDAWAVAGFDRNANGIPDWWEEIAKESYGAVEGFTWDSLVVYDGIQMTAREAYLRDQAKGLLPDGTVNAAFAATADNNNNDMLDWWEDLYGNVLGDAYADPDNDGLSNYAEYLIGEGFSQYGFPRVKPNLPRTFFSDGQKVPDYFLPVGSLYLGEMFADHDFMEDAWEDMFGVDPDNRLVSYVSRELYDPWGDRDGDGWSNFAECRAHTDPRKGLTLSIEEYELAEYPVPLISLTAVRANSKPMSGKLVVRAYSAKSGVAGLPDATWTIAGPGEDATASTKFIGYNPGESMTINLGPGAVVPGSVKFEFNDTYPLTQKDGSQIWTSDGSGWITLVHTYAGSQDKTGAELALINKIVGSVNYENSTATLDFSALEPYVYYGESVISVSRSTNDWTRLDLAHSFVRVTWDTKAVADGSTVKCLLSESQKMSASTGGHVREGKNTFVVFLDTNDDGVWNPGEPYGVDADVDVGWDHAEVKVELTETAPQMVRINLAEAMTATDFSTVNLLTDRGATGTAYYDNCPPYAAGTNVISSSSVRVRIVRTFVNEPSTNSFQNRVVYDELVDVSANPIFSEANLLAKGLFDLDWGTLEDDIVGSAAGITNVTYRIVLGNGDIDYFTLNNILPFGFVNAFESDLRQTETVPDPDLAQLVYSGRPTFRWKHDPLDKEGRRIKDYPAFRARIYDAGGKVVYDSGAQSAPVRDAAGYYSWTAPVSVGMVTEKGHVFQTTNNYSWAVSMLDARHTTFTQTRKTPFRMTTTGNANDGRRHGKIDVIVKYFGPLVGSLSTNPSTLKNIIHVQAFTSPDFAGEPVGEAFVTDVSTIAATNALDVNATILGLPESTNSGYYVRAFIDTNADFMKDKWESWGYGCYVGESSAKFTDVSVGGRGGANAAQWMYTPRAYLVGRNREVPTATVYIEDADTDNDGFPDAWEMQVNGDRETTTPISGNTFFATVNPELEKTLTAFTKLSMEKALEGYPMGLMMADGGSAAFALLSAAPGSAAAINEVVTVKIESFSLNKGIGLSVSSDASVSGDHLTIYTIGDTAKVDVILLVSDTAGSTAREIKVKTITIKANETTSASVTPEELQKAITEAGVSSSALMKVKLVEAQK